MEAAENSAESSAPRVVGRPFEKGKSGNPGGRPKGLAKAVREVPAALGLDDEGAVLLAKFWWSIVGNDKADPSHRLQASKLLAERGWGKPAEFVPIEDDDPLELSERAANVIAGEFNDELDRLRKRRSQQQ